MDVFPKGYWKSDRRSHETAFSLPFLEGREGISGALSEAMAFPNKSPPPLMLRRMDIGGEGGKDGGVPLAAPLLGDETGEPEAASVIRNSTQSLEKDCDGSQRLEAGLVGDNVY